MSNKTPTKIISAVQLNYSPITLHVSPTSTSLSKNLAGLPRVAKDIAADVYNSIQKWNDCHVQGALVVKKVVLLKCTSKKDFPSGLEELIDDLQQIVNRISIYSNSLSFLSNQMSALVKLNNQENPLFFALTARELSLLIEVIAKAYKSECMVKQYVLENIGHSKNENEAMFHGACWIHQQYITSKINLRLEMLLTETGHR